MLHTYGNDKMVKDFYSVFLTTLKFPASRI